MRFGRLDSVSCECHVNSCVSVNLALRYYHTIYKASSLLNRNYHRHRASVWPVVKETLSRVLHWEQSSLKLYTL